MNDPWVKELIESLGSYVLLKTETSKINEQINRNRLNNSFQIRKSLWRYEEMSREAIEMNIKRAFVICFIIFGRIFIIIII